MVVAECAADMAGSLLSVNHPAASSGAWKLKRPRGRGIDPRGNKKGHSCAHQISPSFVLRQDGHELSRPCGRMEFLLKSIVTDAGA